MRPALEALNEEGKPIPAMSLVIANFPQATETVPSLLHRSREVKTFFHELGHALHALLGRTDIASLSGTSVMIDFVESPSQMFEKWLEQPQILKQISSHYRTGEPLSDQVIADIKSSLSFYAANKVQGQILYALYSLACYQTDTLDDPQALYETLQAQICPAIAPDPESRFFASFSHLTGYGASYYSYLYSLVYSEDIFALIMEKGLYNKATGRAYLTHILSKGGSAHPTELLENFLGRKPSADAFLNHLGITRDHSSTKFTTSNTSAFIN
jgi:thimet oligopeptidase